jgi:uncharacterized membrane protein YdbT with pleckstrin-like domain
VVRTIVVIIVALVVVWLEFLSGIANSNIVGLPAVVWTVIVFFFVWLLSLTDLLVQRAANTYILRNDSLELKAGIVTLRSYMIVPSGFSDLEVVQSVTGRALGYGDIIIRLESEVERRLVKVRDPMRVGDQIRSIMARPIVRIEQSQQQTEQKSGT